MPNEFQPLTGNEFRNLFGLPETATRESVARDLMGIPAPEVPAEPPAPEVEFEEITPEELSAIPERFAPGEVEFQEAKEFLPLEDMQRQIDRGEFNPVQFAADYERTTGQSIAALEPVEFNRLVEAYRYQRERGVTLDAIKRAAGQAPGMAKDFLFSIGDLGKSVWNTVVGLAGGDEQRATKALAELNAGLETGSLEFVDFARRAARKVGQKAADIVVPEVFAPTEGQKAEQYKQDFLNDLGVAKQIGEAASGRGEFIKQQGLDADTLAAEGIEIDLDVVNRLSLPLDPTNFIPAAAGFKVLDKLGRTVAVAKTASAAKNAVERINKYVASKAGGAARRTAGAVEGAGRMAQIAGESGVTRGLATGGAIAQVGRAAAAGDAVSLVSVAATAAAPALLRSGGELLEKVGKKAAGGAPLVERATKFVLDNAVAPAAGGAAVGGVFSLPLAALADNDDEAANLIVAGAVFGGALSAAGRGVRVAQEGLNTAAGKLAEIYQTTERSTVESAPYGNPEIDRVHEESMERLKATRPGDANLINVVREAFRAVPTPGGPAFPVEIYLLPSDLFARRTGNDSARGYFVENERAAGGGTATRVYLREDATSIFHEPGHILQQIVMGPEIRAEWFDLIDRTFSPGQQARFKRTYEDLLNGKRPEGQRKELSPQEVREEIGAEILGNVLRGHPLNGMPLSIRQRAAGLVGGALESLGLYRPDTPTGAEVPGIQEGGPGVPRPGGVTDLGIDPSFALQGYGANFLRESGLLGKPVPPGTPPAPVNVPPVPPRRTNIRRPAVHNIPVEPEVDPAGEAGRRNQAQTRAVGADKDAPLGTLDVADDYGQWDRGEKLLAEEGADPELIKRFQEIKAHVLAGKGDVGPVSFDHASITFQDEARPVEGGRRRREREAGYLAEEMGALPEEVRTRYNKIFVPSRVVIRRTKGGKLNLNFVGTSPTKMLGNAMLAAREAARINRLDLIPVETDPKGKITPTGALQLFDMLTQYTQNHANGYAGDGSRIQIPQGYESYVPQENPVYTPRVLPENVAHFVNLLVGIEPPKTNKKGSTKRFTKEGKEIKTPANVEARRLAEGQGRAALPARFSNPQRNVFRDYGVSIAEFNPLRDEFAEAGVNLAEILSEGVEEISLENVKTPIVPSGKSPLRAVSTPLATAGFQPDPAPVSSFRFEEPFRDRPGRHLFRADRDFGTFRRGDELTREQIEQAGFSIPAKADPQAEQAGFFQPSIERPDDLIAEVHEATPEEFKAITDKAKGGLTGLAVDLGLSLTERPQLDVLRGYHKEFSDRSKAAMASGDFNTAMSDVARAQFYREAAEAATGTGSMGNYFQQHRPDVRPPFVDEAAEAAQPGVPLTEQMRAGFMPDVAAPRRATNEDLGRVFRGYASQAGIAHRPEFRPAPLDDSLAVEVADWYEAADHRPDDAEVQRSYEAFARETIEQYKALEAAGYKMEPWLSEGQPYHSSAEMVADVQDNKHLYFFLTEQGFGSTGDSPAAHPMLTDSGIELNGRKLVVNDVFRAVHDMAGHAFKGNQFGARGEFNAWRDHFELYSDTARPSMSAETLGQNSWVNFGPHLRDSSGRVAKKGEAGFVPPQERPFAEQKATVLPSELIQRAAEAARGQTQVAVPGDSNLFQPGPKVRTPVEYAREIARLHDAQGGATFNVKTGEILGRGPAYVVSIYPERSEIVPGKQVSEATLAKFINQNADLLLDERNSLGTWYDHERDKSYVDVSVVTPDRRLAETLGQRFNQISIWDAERGRAIPTGGTGETRNFGVPEAQRLDSVAAEPDAPERSRGVEVADVIKPLTDAVNALKDAIGGQREGGAFQPATSAARALQERGFRFEDQSVGDSVFDLIVTDGDRIVGNITAHLTAPDTAKLDLVDVSSSDRKKGIGEALYRELATWLQRRGVEHLTGNVVSRIPLAIRKRLFGEFESIVTRRDGDLESISEAEAVDLLPDPKDGDTSFLRAISATSRIDPEAKFQPSLRFATKNEQTHPPLVPKSWITPDGEFVPLKGQFHEQWLAKNQKQLQEVFKLVFDKDPASDQGSRLAALNRGFVRVTYEPNGGRLNVEVGRRGFTKAVKDQLFSYVADHLDDIDNMSVSVLDDKGNTVQSASAQLFLMDDADKLNNLPLITDERSAGRFQPSLSDLPGLDLGDAVRTAEEVAAEAYPEARPVKYARHRNGKIVRDERGNASPIVEPYNFEKSPLAKEARKAGEDPVDRFARAMVEEYRRHEGIPGIADGLDWYESTRRHLRETFGDDWDLFAQLLAATSPATTVDTNFTWALDAYNKFRLGEFDAMLEKYNDGSARLRDGRLERAYRRAHPGEEYSQANLMEWWIDKHDLYPKSSNGKRFGLHSRRILQVLSGRWLEENQGPKVRQFYDNLTGNTFGATIDVWAARLLHRLGHEGRADKWRLLPQSETGVKDADFAFGQAVFEKAADELGLKPDALQAFMWFLEKDIWQRRGWTDRIGARKATFSDLLQGIEVQPDRTFRRTSPQKELDLSEIAVEPAK